MDPELAKYITPYTLRGNPLGIYPWSYQDEREFWPCIWDGGHWLVLDEKGEASGRSKPKCKTREEALAFLAKLVSPPDPEARKKAQRACGWDV